MRECARARARARVCVCVCVCVCVNGVRTRESGRRARNNQSPFVAQKTQLPAEANLIDSFDSGNPVRSVTAGQKVCIMTVATDNSVYTITNIRLCSIQKTLTIPQGVILL